MSQARTIRLEQDILGENDRHAARNRENFTAHGVLALNLVSSPGSGKTTLLCSTLMALRQRRADLPLAVIEAISKPVTTPSASAKPAYLRSRSTPAKAAT
jgi:hydrogenase nickel incorporation protein HypB